MHAKPYSLILGSIAMWLQYASILICGGLLVFGFLFGGIYYYPNTFWQFFYLPIGVSIFASLLGVVGLFTFAVEYRQSKRSLRSKPLAIGAVMCSLSLLPLLLEWLFLFRS